MWRSILVIKDLSLKRNNGIKIFIYIEPKLLVCRSISIWRLCVIASTNLFLIKGILSIGLFEYVYNLYSPPGRIWSLSADLVSNCARNFIKINAYPADIGNISVPVKLVLKAIQSIKGLLFSQPLNTLTNINTYSCGSFGILLNIYLNLTAEDLDAYSDIIKVAANNKTLSHPNF